MTQDSRQLEAGQAGSYSLALKLLALVGLLYAFLVSIGLLGAAFKLFGKGFVTDLIGEAQSPVAGLFIGVLATTLMQSSSTTTSLVVALVGSGSMSVPTAIPVIMGANIGTTVTNTLVSLGHVTRGREFYRAFAASTVHDFFNLLAVAVLFPLQVSTNCIGMLAHGLAELFQSAGGLTFASPLKILTAPAVNLGKEQFHDYPWLLAILALILMFVALRYLVVTLKSLVLARVEALFDAVIFRNAARAMVFGALLTVLVQSSSITTSLVIPLAGAGILGLRQIFPYTLGANIGTTITAILAALAVGQVATVTVAFAHLLFNLCGIVLIWPIPAVRELPIRGARWLAGIARSNRWIAVVYIVVAFYLVPFAVVMLLR